MDAPTLGGAAGAATADVFFVLDNADEAFRPGERVAVDVTLGPAGGATASAGADPAAPTLALPAAALLYDASGGQWVYVRTGPQRYTRHRVEVRSAPGEQFIVTRGVAAGDSVVTDGAAELFGTEFGGSH